MGAAFSASGDHIIFANNLVLANHNGTGTAISLTSNNGVGIYVINNTVLSNTTDSTSLQTATGLGVSVAGYSAAFIANNVLWGNQTNDLHLFVPAGSSSIIHLKNNGIGSQAGITASVDVDNFSSPPMFVAAGDLDFTPASNSPLVNAGRHPPTFIPTPTPFELDWTLPVKDLAGRTRVIGGRVDIGAYESPNIIFINGFE